MALVMTPIYTQTVSGSTVNTITFNNIPQHFTDVVIRLSLRDSTTSFANGGTYGITINGDTSTSSYSQTRLFGTGSTTGSGRASSQSFNDTSLMPNTASTSNTFGSAEVYIPNYTSSNFKSFTVDSVVETNATAAYSQLIAGLWRQTAAISNIIIYNSGSASYYFSPNSTISLYGIIRSGA